MKKILLALVCLAVWHAHAQTVPSPEQFLGYKPGTRFTPEYKVLNYFKAVAQARPDMVKTASYGETYEGRELMLAYVASPANLPNLEAIRTNNLRMAGVLKDQPATDNKTIIVWLSYNVHGNEPSSSEAAMQTLYALAGNDSQQTKQWLQNTVVIMDPCVNPDGHDRYVNWYNSVVGAQFNADPQAREHDEPWPGGRSNHYNFDLNRDWAWQTQLETQQRVKKYNEWLPQVHVDYHEQGYNQPYYFAPAAEPFHEVITPWQREFQVMIGKNNAKYFDNNGWLYFTKERFDLFYPSYGDTYPLYSGAIGMTFEQGGIRAGLGVKKEDDDTLTLVKRVAHHYTTGLSTIETAAANAPRLLQEYRQFFTNSGNAKDAPYKTYVLTSNDINQLKSVARLLDLNGISYGALNTKTFSGYNYFTGKEEAYKGDAYTLAVSALQPRSTLLRVLFEPKSTLSDSITYDITAWSLPYAYNIKSYAVKEKLDMGSFTSTAVTPVTSGYGVLIPYTSVASAQVMSYLINKKVKLRFAQKDFTYKGKDYASGTLIVLNGGNDDDWNKLVNEACAKYNLQPVAVESGFMDKGADFGSPDIHFIPAPKVLMLTGEQVSSLGAGEVWSFFEQTLHYPITLANTERLQRLDLSNYTVIILPDGNYRSLGDKAIEDKLKNFVRDGGKLIAIEDAVNSLADNNWGIKEKEEDEKDGKKDTSAYQALKKYGSRQRDEMPEEIPGAIYKVNLDNTHPLAFGYSDTYYTLKQSSHMYQFLKDGWNVGVIKKDSHVAGFVGSKLKQRLKDGLTFGVQDMGRGTIVYLVDNPLFRHFWEGGKLLFTNAVFLAGE
ncbi:M14 family metallopeptidase [Deminuibacter soli]|uniref:Zinc carboxypeptidase n=1 Tax=Deminuibacter soli TaxID=2291815 RepID=A0A3E1NC34_9BACT|nr:M14 family metallopeptidase [Deminuibacter soli]RFM25579.1 zinc carboxypeptidase [Deminuibacter soli]